MTSSNSEKIRFLRREVDVFFQTHEGGDFDSKEKECSSSTGWKVWLVTMEPKAPFPALSLGSPLKSAPNLTLVDLSG